MNFISTNPKYKFESLSSTNKELSCIVVENVENGFMFYIAKDSMGTQICNDGKFFPDSRDFGSIVNALRFLRADNNLEEAERFFKESPEPSIGEGLFNIMVGLAIKDEEKYHDNP